MKKKVFLILPLTGEWGLIEKHSQPIINIGKILISFYKF